MGTLAANEDEAMSLSDDVVVEIVWSFEAREARREFLACLAGMSYTGGQSRLTQKVALIWRISNVSLGEAHSRSVPLFLSTRRGISFARGPASIKFALTYSRSMDIVVDIISARQAAEIL